MDRSQLEGDLFVDDERKDVPYELASLDVYLYAASALSCLVLGIVLIEEGQHFVGGVVMLLGAELIIRAVSPNINDIVSHQIDDTEQ